MGRFSGIGSRLLVPGSCPTDCLSPTDPLGRGALCCVRPFFRERPVNAVRRIAGSRPFGRRIGLDQGDAPSYGLNVKTGTFNK